MTVDGREIASVSRIIYVHNRVIRTERLRAMFRLYGGWDPVEKG